MFEELVSRAVSLLVALLLVVRFGRPSPAQKRSQAIAIYRKQWAAIVSMRRRVLAIRLQVVML